MAQQDNEKLSSCSHLTLRFINWRAWRVVLTLTAPALALLSSTCLP